MGKHLNAQSEKVSYDVKRSVRARHLRISVHHDCRVVLTVPHRSSLWQAERFLYDKIDWVIKTIKRLKSRPPRPVVTKNRHEYLSYKDSARQLITQRLDYFNQWYGFSYNRVTVKNQTSRWGSCSVKKNLNFNYRLFFLPPNLQDYIVVHELCHLQELNHSSRFWQLVAKTVPDYKIRRRQLRNIASSGQYRSPSL